MEELLRILRAEFASAGIDLQGLAFAWARVLPTLLIVPAFGLRALPAPARAVFALSLAAAVAPAISPASHSGPLPWALLTAALQGLPVALAAATLLWAATMAGGVIDNLRGGREQGQLAVVEGGATPLGVLLSMIAALAFLRFGGAARVGSALARPTLGVEQPLTQATLNLVASIEIALALAAPLIVASIVIDLTTSLMTRALNPASVNHLLGPLRNVAVLALAALLLERIAEVLTGYTVKGLPS